MANRNLITGSTIGFPAGTVNSGTSDCNSALKFESFAFSVDAADTITSVLVYLGGYGTQANRSLQCHVYDNSGNLPNASLSYGTLTNFATGLQTITMNQVIAAQTRYHIVFKNLATVPATDYFRVYYASGFGIAGVSSSGTYEYTESNSPDGGSSWSAASAGKCGVIIGLASGRYIGFSATAQLTAQKYYGIIEGGVKFVTPANATLRITAACMCIYKSGTPTGNVSLKLRYGSTVAQTESIPASVITTGGGVYYMLKFAGVQSIPPSSICRLTIFDDAADSSSAYYSTQGYTFPDSDTVRGCISLLAQLSETTDNTANPIVWTDTNTKVYPFVFLLDGSQEFYTNNFKYIHKSRKHGF